MSPKKNRQKSPSVSSVDSGLGSTMKNKFLMKPSSMNYSQQLLKAASLTAKTQLLKKGLKDSDEKVQNLMKIMSPSIKSESESDSEDIIPSSQFSPLASSTQMIKKSESTSEDSDDGDINSSKNREMSAMKIKKVSPKSRSTQIIKRHESTSECSDGEINSHSIIAVPRSTTILEKKSKVKRESKINIINNQLIQSENELKEEDSDSKSVVSVRRPVPSYSVSSESSSEDDNTRKHMLEGHTKNIHLLKRSPSLSSSKKVCIKKGDLDSGSSDSQKNQSFTQNTSHTKINSQANFRTVDSHKYESPRLDVKKSKQTILPSHIDKDESEADSDHLSNSEYKNLHQPKNRKTIIKDVPKKIYKSEVSSGSDSEEDLATVRTSDVRKDKSHLNKEKTPREQKDCPQAEIKNDDSSSESGHNVESKSQSSSTDSSDEAPRSKSKQQVASTRPSKVLPESKLRNNVSSSESEQSEKPEGQSRSEDNSSEEASRTKSEQQVPDNPIDILRNFLQKNKDYKSVKIPENAELSALDSDDEVYLLQIPKTVNPRIMKGVSFSLTDKSKIKTDAGKYVIKQQAEAPSSLLVYSNTLKRIKPVATLKMEKYLKTNNQNEIVVEERKKKPLPNNIKVRHPLFGPDYESKINLEQQIKEKLQQALQRFQIKEKSKRKKRNRELDNSEDKSILITKILEEKLSKVNRSNSNIKKIECPTVDNNQNRHIKAEWKLEDLEELIQTSKKKKKNKEVPYVNSELKPDIDEITKVPEKKKKNKDSTLHNIKVEFDPDYLGDNSKIPGTKNRNDREIKNIKTELELDDLDVTTKISKKKKKHSKDEYKEVSSESNNEIVKIKTEQVDAFYSPTDLLDENDSKRKKKRKRLLEMSEVKDESLQESFCIDSGEPRKKRKRKHNLSENSLLDISIKQEMQTENEIEDESEMNESEGKMKNRKKKGSKYEIDSQSISEMNESKEQKKKKKKKKHRENEHIEEEFS